MTRPGTGMIGETRSHYTGAALQMPLLAGRLPRRHRAAEGGRRRARRRREGGGAQPRPREAGDSGAPSPKKAGCAMRGPGWRDRSPRREGLQVAGGGSVRQNAWLGAGVQDTFRRG